MGERKKPWTEFVGLRLFPGTTAKIDAVLYDDESRSDMMRIAIEREVLRRQKEHKERARPMTIYLTDD